MISRVAFKGYERSAFRGSITRSIIFHHRLCKTRKLWWKREVLSSCAAPTFLGNLQTKKESVCEHKCVCVCVCVSINVCAWVCVCLREGERDSKVICLKKNGWSPQRLNSFWKINKYLQISVSNLMIFTFVT